MIPVRARRFLLAAALVALAPAARAEGPETHETARVRVESAVPGVAQRAAEVLEAAIPVFEEHLSWRLPKDARMVVRLHSTPDEYAEAVKAANAEDLAPNQAATVRSTKESQLVVQPRSDPVYLEAVGGLPQHTRYLLLHEGVHQFLYRAEAAGVYRWPDWYAEGMADVLAERALAKSDGRSPRAILLDDRDHLVRSALEEGRAPRLERLLHANQETLSDRRLFYACWQSFYRFLAADGARMADLHRRVKKACEEAPDAGAVDLEKAFAGALTSSYGPTADLEARWTKVARATTSAWFEGVRASQHQGEEMVVASWPEGTAYALRVEPALSKPVRISFEMFILEGASQAEVYLAYERRSDPRFLKVALGPKGYATLLAFSDGSWQERYRRGADVDPELLAPGRWIPVRVEAGAGRVKVDLPGKTVLDVEVPPSWKVEGNLLGLGCQQGACRFRSLRVEALPAR